MNNLSSKLAVLGVVALIVMIGVPTLVWERGAPRKLDQLVDLGSLRVPLGAPQELPLPISGTRELRIKVHDLLTGVDESAALSCLNEIRRARRISLIPSAILHKGSLYRVVQLSSRNGVTRKSETRLLFISQFGAALLSTPGTAGVKTRPSARSLRTATVCGEFGRELYAASSADSLRERMSLSLRSTIEVAVSTRDGVPTLSVTLRKSTTYQIMIGEVVEPARSSTSKGTRTSPSQVVWRYRLELSAMRPERSERPSEGDVGAPKLPPGPTSPPLNSDPRAPVATSTPAEAGPPPPPQPTSTPTATPTRTSTPTSLPTWTPSNQTPTFSFNYEALFEGLLDHKVRLKGSCDSSLGLMLDRYPKEPLVIPCVGNAFNLDLPTAELGESKYSSGFEVSLRTFPPGSPYRSVATVVLQLKVPRRPDISDFPNGRVSSSLPSRTASERTLVLYNTNVTTAGDVARYYAQRRGIPSRNVCGVPFVPGLYASVQEYEGVKRKILNECVCPIAAFYEPTLNCATTKPSLLQRVTLIDTLVFTRGWPARILSDPEEPSLDAFMTHDLFADSPDGRSPFSVAWGRVDGVTAERAKQLVDRALQTESLGLRGNILTELRPLIYGLRYGDSVSSMCKENLEGRKTWDPAQCKVGFEATGKVPGYLGSQLFNTVIPNVQIFMGSDPNPNGQEAFNGFWEGFLKWRKGSGACVPLCANLTTAAERGACREASTDYFKELNTSCVGAAPGFIGQQVRSYVVNNFGFFPPGYNAEFFGHYENAPPELVRVGSIGEVPDYIVRFGMRDAVANPRCFDSAGATFACEERLPLSMNREHVPLKPIPVVNGAFSLTITADVRNKKNPGGALGLRVLPILDDGTMLNEGVLAVLFDQERPAMERLSRVVSWSGIPSGRTITKFHVDWRSGVNSRGFYEVDNVQVFNSLGESLLSPQDSTFAGYHQKLTHGAWATVAIERLGATAWWGSSSHFATSGYALTNHTAFFDEFVRGKRLGEALHRSERIHSGLIYGDPLFSPAGADITVAVPKVKFLRNTPEKQWALGEISIEPHLPLSDWNFISIDGERDATLSSPLLVTAFNGDLPTTWEVDVCYDKRGPRYCDQDKSWRGVTSGSGKLREPTSIGVTLRSQIQDLSKVTYINLRITVRGGTNPTLRSYQLFRFVP